MKTITAIKYFEGTGKLAAALNKCNSQAVSQWGEFPPYGRQCEIELLTGGALKREPKASICKKATIQSPVNNQSIKQG